MMKGIDPNYRPSCIKEVALGLGRAFIITLIACIAIGGALGFLQIHMNIPMGSLNAIGTYLGPLGTFGCAFLGTAVLLVIAVKGCRRDCADARRPQYTPLLVERENRSK